MSIVWGDDTSGQDDMIPLEFIVDRQKRLKKLELQNCAINVRGPRHYNWADISGWPANALTTFVELKVDFNLKEDGIPYVYECYSPFYHMKEKKKT